MLYVDDFFPIVMISRLCSHFLMWRLFWIIWPGHVVSDPANFSLSVLVDYFCHSFLQLLHYRFGFIGFDILLAIERMQADFRYIINQQILWLNFFLTSECSTSLVYVDDLFRSFWLFFSLTCEQGSFLASTFAESNQWTRRRLAISNSNERKRNNNLQFISIMMASRFAFIIDALSDYH